MTAMPWRPPRWRSLICFPVVTRKRDARLRRALDLDPNSMFARGYLGGSYAFGGDFDAALSDLDEALRLSPRGLLLIIWHLGKGWAALLAGHDEEAVEYAMQTAEANPEFSDIYAVLALRQRTSGESSPGFVRHWISCRGACPT